MQIQVNGEPRTLAPNDTISTLLKDLGLAGAACAVEVNRELIPKARHESVTLKSGDVVEVVTLVGGG